MPHSGLQSTIQLALHFGGVNATPGFLLNGWRKLFFHFRWYGSRPTYEYAIGLLLLCCILFTVSLHISVAHFDLPQIYFDTVYEHCRFTFISGICAVCGYYCLIVDVLELKRSYIL